MVEHYKYLGLEFESTMNWKIAKQRLVMKAKSKLALLSKALKEGISLQAGENIG